MSGRAAKPFLRADWRYLAMLNFTVDPAVLQPLVPRGTELDYHGGETFVSVVGFLFLDTRVLGMRIPFHRDFEEVNLRFYVRRNMPGGWRRGVVFIRELVPRAAIAVIARAFYDEPYSAVPMRHRISHQGDDLEVRYEWRNRRTWETLAMSASGEPQSAADGSHEEFITEHYWGYTARADGRTSEYQVEHPRWRLWTARTHRFDADVETLYGRQFCTVLMAQPVSAFIADGSHVEVRRRSTE